MKLPLAIIAALALCGCREEPKSKFDDSYHLKVLKFCERAAGALEQLVEWNQRQDREVMELGSRVKQLEAKDRESKPCACCEIDCNSVTVPRRIIEVMVREPLVYAWTNANGVRITEQDDNVYREDPIREALEKMGWFEVGPGQYQYRKPATPPSPDELQELKRKVRQASKSNREDQ